jgi:tRNA (guanine-N7-)-methyltransferase
MPEHALRHTIRSFVLRAGRMGSGQQKALDELGPLYVLPYRPVELNLETAFQRNTAHQAEKILEIGFGMGAATAEIAANHPEKDYLGLEVHTPGVGALLKQIGEQNLTNLRIIQHDAVEVMQHMIPNASLDGIHIYFPDPWHKSKHHKRRLIQPGFVALLVQKLKPGAYLHLATDWDDYAQQMLSVLSAELQLKNTVTDFAPRPEFRPLTKFEQRGLRLGHGVWDLVFRRI